MGIWWGCGYLSGKYAWSPLYWCRYIYKHYHTTPKGRTDRFSPMFKDISGVGSPPPHTHTHMISPQLKHGYEMESDRPSFTCKADEHGTICMTFNRYINLGFWPLGSRVTISTNQHITSWVWDLQRKRVSYYTRYRDILTDSPNVTDFPWMMKPDRLSASNQEDMLYTI